MAFTEYTGPEVDAPTFKEYTGPEVTPAPAERGLIGETVAGVKRGGLQLLDMAGNIARTVDPEGGVDVVRNAGLGISKFAKERATRPDIAETTYGETHPILGNIPKAAEMVIPSVGVPLIVGTGAAAAGLSAPVAAGAGVIGSGLAFGLSQFQDTKERGLEAGLTEEQATTAGIKTGLSEGGLEALSSAIPAAKIFKLGKPVAGSVVKSLFKAPSAKAAAKTLVNDAAQIMAGEVSTEMAQAYTQGLTEKNAGIRPDADPIKEAKDVIGPTIALSLMLGGAVGGANKLSKMATQRALQNAGVGEDVRRQAAANVHAALLAEEEAGNVPAGAAENWKSNTEAAIAAKAPLTLSDELLQAAERKVSIEVSQEDAAANILDKLAAGVSPSDAIEQHNADVANHVETLKTVRDTADAVEAVRVAAEKAPVPGVSDAAIAEAFDFTGTPSATMPATPAIEPAAAAVETPAKSYTPDQAAGISAQAETGKVTVPKSGPLPWMNDWALDNGYTITREGSTPSKGSEQTRDWVIKKNAAAQEVANAAENRVGNQEVRTEPAPVEEGSNGEGARRVEPAPAAGESTQTRPGDSVQPAETKVEVSDRSETVTPTETKVEVSDRAKTSTPAITKHSIPFEPGQGGAFTSSETGRKEGVFRTEDGEQVKWVYKNAAGETVSPVTADIMPDGSLDIAEGTLEERITAGKAFKAAGFTLKKDVVPAAPKIAKIPLPPPPAKKPTTANLRAAMAAFYKTTEDSFDFEMVAATGEHAAADAIAKEFGKRVYVIDTKSDKRLGNAFVIQPFENAIFIAKDAEKPAVALLGHESVHLLRRDAPELYTELVGHVLSGAEKKRFHKYLAWLKTASPVYAELDHPKIIEEYVGNVVGNQFTRQPFWQEVAKTNPALFSKVLSYVRDLVEKAKTALSKEKFAAAAATQRDMKQLDVVTAAIFSKYSRLYTAGKFDVDVNAQVHDVKLAARAEAPMLKSAASMFDEKAFGNLKTPVFKSREKLIEMPIKDFLSLAEFTRGSQDKQTRVAKLLEAGTKFSDLPYLLTDTKDGASKVVGHEGRHRAEALSELGYDTMPVVIRDRAIRWDQQADPEKFDYVEKWPTALQAETGTKSLPFPITREDAAKPYVDTTQAELAAAVRPFTTRKIGADLWTVIRPNGSATGQYKTEGAALSAARQRNKLADDFKKAGQMEIQFSAREDAGPWYSKLTSLFEERLKSVNQDKALPASHFQAILKAQGVSPDEIEASGIKVFLDSKERFSANEVLDELKANAVQLKDVVLGDISQMDKKLTWSNYVSDGEQNWMDNNDAVNIRDTGIDGPSRFVVSEMLDGVELGSAGTLDAAKQIGADQVNAYPGNYLVAGSTKFGPTEGYGGLLEPGYEEGSYREMFVTVPNSGKNTEWIVLDEVGGEATRKATKQEALDYAAEWRYKKGVKEVPAQQDWQDGHSQYSDIQNPVVRIRFDERKQGDVRTLFVEEIQGPSEQNQTKMPTYLKKRIYDLGVKRVLTYAKENGFDAVAWTTGEMQAKRYDLSQEINQIQWDSEEGNSNKMVVIDAKGGNGSTIAVDDSGVVRSGPSTFRNKQLDEIIGKDLAKQILGKSSGTLSGLDLKVGGEGLKALYDRTLPSLFKKYGGGEIEKQELRPKEKAVTFEEWKRRNYPGVATDQSMRDEFSKHLRLQPVEDSTVSMVRITDKTPTSQAQFAASVADFQDSTKNVSEWFKALPAKRMLNDALTAAYRWLMPVDKVVTMAASQSDYLPIKANLKRFLAQRKEMAGYKTSSMIDGHHVTERIGKAFKSNEDMAKLENLVWKATTYELHADPARHNDWTEEGWNAADMPALTGKTLTDALQEVHSLYAQFTPEQKVAHQTMLDQVNTMYLEGRTSRLKVLETGYGDKVAEAEAFLKSGAEEIPQDLIDVVPLVKTIYDQYPLLKGDYMPLMRFGDHAVRTYNVDENGELGNRVRTEFFSSKQDAQDYVNKINQNPRNGLHAKVEVRPDMRRDVVNIPLALIDKFRAAAEARGFSGEALETMVQDLAGLRVNMLPRTSTAAGKLHRENVEGYSQDVMKVFATYVRNHAIANANMIHGSKIEQTFRDMRNNIDAHNSDPANPADPNAVQNMYNLMNNLYALEKAGNQEKINEVIKAANKATFVWFLASPSVWAVQWSQPFMTTIPKMAARFGFGTAFKAYTSAAKQYMSGKFSDEKIDTFDREHGYVGQKMYDLIDSSRDATPAEKVKIDRELKAIYNGFASQDDKRLLILKVLSHQGALDLSSSHSIQDLAAGTSEGELFLDKVVDKAGFFMQKSETGSRRAGAVAAFELAMSEGKGFIHANDYTSDIINDTLFNFDSQNRGPAWRGNTGRILGQFQFFRFHMVGKLIQLTKDAMGGEYNRLIQEAGNDQAKIAEARKMKSEARRELAYVTGSAFALAGAGGTPLALAFGNTASEALWDALAFLFGDDDDPWDPKREFELAVRDSLGDVVGNVVLKGLPSLVGADVSRRIGLGGMADMIQGDPPAGATGTAKANWYAGRILGPTWGIMTDAMRASDALAEGDLSKALQFSSPKAFKDFMKSLDVADSGVKAGGKTLVQPEDVSLWSYALMLSGINPMEVALAQEENRYIKNLSTTLSQKRSALVKAMADATVRNDPDAQTSAAERINDWAIAQPKLKITSEELVRGIKKIRDGEAGKLSKREMLIKGSE